MGDFDGRVALVTGAGSGIGRAVALEMARSGARVVVTDISLPAAEQTVEAITGSDGDRPLAHQMDVTSSAQVTATVAEVSRSIGPITILVNCAGVSSMIPFLSLTEQDWDFMMNVNAKGVFLVTREVVRSMVANGGGSVVSIASAAAKDAAPNLAHYSASKWAVLGLTQSVAREVARSGVRVNAVCPGTVRTPMQDREVVWEGTLRHMDPEAVRQSYIDYTPLHRLGEPEDVADVVHFLCSERARFMTGQAINITGGMVMH
jgi:meso-butanediol dehydrogenase/(S,S)-butanediol dehydrogenase/diacetyl reductase